MPAPHLHHEVHYRFPHHAKMAKAVAVVRAESVEEAEAVFAAEIAPLFAEVKIVKIIVPAVLLRRAA